MDFEQFAELTPRQFHGLLNAIMRNDAIDYYRLCTAQGREINHSLDEYLAIVFNEEPESQIDNVADKKLEEYAQKQFEEMKKKHGGQ